MCSRAVLGAGDGQCWMGTKHTLCPGRSRDLSAVTGPLKSALLCHSITGLVWWPGIHCQTPVPALESPCKAVGRQRTRVPGCVAGPRHPQGLSRVWLPCLHCWQLLLLTSTQGWGAGVGSTCTEQGHCTKEGAVPLQPPPRGCHILVVPSHC